VPQLPALRTVRLDREPESVRYVARPGLAAMPSGAGPVLGFLTLQTWTAVFLLWAMWWPAPRTTQLLVFAIGGTTLLVGLLLFVAWLLMRQYPGFVTAVLRAPFIRLTVTNHRVIWSLPWMRHPLMEIGQDRIHGGILGAVDARGRGNAAMMLVEGDPAADVDGHIHFDRLPDVRRFVEAIGGL
jgi:hypothetical protein